MPARKGGGWGLRGRGGVRAHFDNMPSTYLTGRALWQPNCRWQTSGSVHRSCAGRCPSERPTQSRSPPSARCRRRPPWFSLGSAGRTSQQPAHVHGGACNSLPLCSSISLGSAGLEHFPSSCRSRDSSATLRGSTSNPTIRYTAPSGLGYWEKGEGNRQGPNSGEWSSQLAVSSSPW